MIFFFSSVSVYMSVFEVFIANLCLAPTRVMLPGYHTGNVGTNCEGFFLMLVQAFYLYLTCQMS